MDVRCCSCLQGSFNSRSNPAELLVRRQRQASEPVTIEKELAALPVPRGSVGQHRLIVQTIVSKGTIVGSLENRFNPRETALNWEDAPSLTLARALAWPASRARGPLRYSSVARHAAP